MSKRQITPNSAAAKKTKTRYTDQELFDRLQSNNKRIRFEIIEHIVTLDRDSRIYQDNQKYKTLQAALIHAFNALTDEEQRWIILHLNQNYWAGMPDVFGLELLTLTLSNMRTSALFNVDFLMECEQKLSDEFKYFLVGSEPPILERLIAMNNDWFHYLTGIYESKQTEKIIRMVVKNNPGSFQRFREKFRNQKDIALEAVSHAGQQLWAVGDALKRDEEVVFAAVSDYGNALKWAHIKTFNIVKKAVENEPAALEFAEAFNDNYEIVMNAVQKRGRTLKYASERLKNNYFIITLALHNNKTAVIYIGEHVDNIWFQGRMSEHRHSMALQERYGRASRFIGTVGSTPLRRRQIISAANFLIRMIQKMRTNRLLRNRNFHVPNSQITDYLHHDKDSALKF